MVYTKFWRDFYRGYYICPFQVAHLILHQDLASNLLLRKVLYRSCPNEAVRYLLEPWVTRPIHQTQPGSNSYTILVNDGDPHILDIRRLQPVSTRESIKFAAVLNIYGTSIRISYPRILDIRRLQPVSTRESIKFTICAAVLNTYGTTIRLQPVSTLHSSLLRQVDYLHEFIRCSTATKGGLTTLFLAWQTISRRTPRAFEWYLSQNHRPTLKCRTTKRPTIQMWLWENLQEKPRSLAA